MVQHLQTRFSALFARYMFLGTLTVILVLVAPDPAKAQARKIELGDLQKIVNVSSPAISPDGKSIVIIVSRVNWDEDRYDSQLVLVDIATGAQRPLTNIRKGLTLPQWSPSGERLAFLAEGGEEKTAAAQIFVLPMNGGEPQQITSAPLGVEQFAWRPDGTFLAFVAADEPPNKVEIEKHHDFFEVGDNDFLVTSAPTPSHIWLVSASGGTAKRLTSGTWSLAKTPEGFFNPHPPLSWSPDGKRICFTRQADPHFGDSDQTVIDILDVDDGQIRQLTKRSSFESFGLFSPDGSKIAYWYPRDGDTNNENEVFVASSAGGEGTDLTRALDRNVQRAIWMPDGKSLLVSGDDATRRAVWIQPLEGSARKIDLGDATVNWDFSVAVGKDGSIAFTGSTATQPSELYYLASTGAKPKHLTDFNHEIAALDLGRIDTFEWKGPDGFAADGTLVYPPNFSRNKKYPLAVDLHGAPQFLASVTEFDFLLQLFASHGYVVFAPNYLGTDNLGNQYEHAVFVNGNAGDGPGRNIMAGIAALERQGFIDESRIGVSGWSWGGYMTSWLIGHYHIWKAAVAGAAVTSMTDWYTLTDVNVTERFEFGGSPWKKEYAKAYEEQSAITYASAVTTPTLILHNTGDATVPITSSYAFYHALKDNGVTVKFIAFPIPGHDAGDPVHDSDTDRVWLEWFDKYLK
jgi:dipeptidyl aminopeptidase/acylaminoacyl peptidase